MSPKVFSIEEREHIRSQILDAGFNLLKQHGMTHTSVDKVMKEVGLGKSTFYNFFHSKELFIYEIILHQRKKGRQKLLELLDGRERLTASEAREYLKFIFLSENSVYQYLTPEDEYKLMAVLPKEYFNDAEAESKAFHYLIERMENIREDIDFRLVGNYMKILAMILESKTVLNQDVLDETLERFFELIFACIFENGG